MSDSSPHPIRYTADPSVHIVCEVVMDVARDALARVPSLDAVWLAGALARGEACGTIVRGVPLLLSDVEFVVVSTRTRREVFRDLVAVSAHVTKTCTPQGFHARLDFTVLTPREVERGDLPLLLHDIAEHGRLVLSDGGRLVDLAATLAGQPVPRREGRRLLLDRLARQLRALDSVASADPRRRMIARVGFSDAYADNERALRIAWGASAAATFRHTLLEQQSDAAERWRAFRRTPILCGDSAAHLFQEWCACLQHQLDTLHALDASRRPRAPDPFRTLAQWREFRAFSPGIRERLGFGGSPLEVAHARIRATVRELLVGPTDVRMWAQQAARDLAMWRTVRHGGSDVPPAFAAVVSNALQKVGIGGAGDLPGQSMESAS